MKKFLWGILGIALIGWILYSNMQEQETMTDDKKTVFVILPMTGSAAVWGDLFSRGVDYFNAKNPNAAISVKIIDSQFNNTAMISALQQEFLKAKPYAMVVPLSPTAVPASIYAKQEGVFTLAMACTDKVLENDNVQRFYPSGEDDMKPLVEIAKKNYKTLAIIYGNDEGSISNKNIMMRDYPDNEHLVVALESFEATGNDTRTMIYKVLQHNPEAIYVEGYGAEYWNIIRSLKSVGYQGKILSDMAFNDPTQIKNLGNAAENVIFMASKADIDNSATPSIQEIQKFYQQRYNQSSNYAGVLVYDALSALNDLAKKNTVLSRNAFENLKTYQGVNGTIEFLPNGDMHYPWIAVVIKDGKIVPVE